jgi:hypothetical protein
MNKEQALQEIKTRLKALFTSEEIVSTEVKLYQCTTMDGQVLETDGATLEVGAAIYKIDGEGNRTPAEDGVYPTDEYSIEVKDGAVVGIMETEVEVEVENPAEPVEATEKVETEMVMEPKADESKDEFVSRCVSYEVGNGKEQDQALGMCYAIYDEKMGSDKMESEKETNMSELESKVLEMSNMITSLIDITEKLSEKIINLSNQPAVVPVIMEKNLTPAELRVERLKSLTKNK